MLLSCKQLSIRGVMGTGIVHVLLVAILVACGSADDQQQSVIADAGPDRDVLVGEMVTLSVNGSRAADEQSLAYTWRLEQIPSGSEATLSTVDSVTASFVPDVEGSYRISLIVASASASARDEVIIRAGGMSLEAGSTVTGLDGVSIGATEGALDDSVGIIIERFEGADNVPDLDGYVSTVGDTYRIRATRNLRTPLEAPLIVGLPLPEASEPSQLAVAVHVPGHDDHLSGWGWPDAKYDADSGLMLALLYGLSEEGLTVTLFKNENGTGLATAAVSLETQAEVVNGLAARCRGFYSETECTSAEERDAANALAVFYREMVEERGFNKPLLTPLFGPGWSLFPPTISFDFALAWHVIDLRPSDSVWCDGVYGKYIAPLAEVVICMPRNDRNSMIPERIQTIFHEVFHAIQYSYPNITLDIFEPWLIEGTATAAERSRGMMEVDGERSRRRVDVPLTDAGDNSTVEYQAQDFWVFAGRRSNRGIDYLEAVLAEGTSVGEVNIALNRTFGIGLDGIYWDWVKNQVFEARVEIGPGGNSPSVLNEPCVFNSRMAGQVRNRTFDLSSGQLTDSFPLPPLSARVVKVLLQALPDAGYEATIEVDKVGAPIRAKIYDEETVDTTNCHAEFESPTRTIHVPQGQDTVVYVLVANTKLAEYSGPGSGEWVHPVISVTAERLSVSITKPENGMTFREGETIWFEAQADGPNPLREWLKWSGDGIDVWQWSEMTGYTPEYTLPCQGQYSVTVTAIDERGLTATDDVTFTVENVLPEVGIIINSPVGEGGFLSMDADIKDSVCGAQADGKQEPVTRWFVNGMHVATGRQLRNIKVTQSAGALLTVRVEHTDAWGSDAEAFKVFIVEEAPTSGWPPEIEITGVGGIIEGDLQDLYIEPRAVIQDDEPLSASSIRWYLEGQYIGSGNNLRVKLVDAGINYYGSFELRAEVTDADGNTAEATTTFITGPLL